MVKIIADSTCDLSQKLLEKYDIEVIPLQILLGDKNYEDGSGVTPTDIFRWSDEHKSSPKTAACRQETARAVLKPHVRAGEEVICFTISDQMSCTPGVIRMAAESLDAASQVTVFETGNLSTGVGLMAVRAAEMAQSGASREEIIREMTEMKALVRSSFVVDTLTYLHRGGRCSGAAALAAGTLRLHPLITVTDGHMEPGKKYRGRMNRVIDSYVEDITPELIKADKRRVFITHAACSEETLHAVYEKVSALGHFEEIHITAAGCVVSSHCGPGTLGVMFTAGK